ncbi:hypothetical protein NL676_017751 [Syzygium grande]|nr:hypothetical protein NL676_017751 [Syzygium grande]
MDQVGGHRATPVAHQPRPVARLTGSSPLARGRGWIPRVVGLTTVDITRQRSSSYHETRDTIPKPWNSSPFAARPNEVNRPASQSRTLLKRHHHLVVGRGSWATNPERPKRRRLSRLVEPPARLGSARLGPARLPPIGAATAENWRWEGGRKWAQLGLAEAPARCGLPSDLPPPHSPNPTSPASPGHRHVAVAPGFVAHPPTRRLRRRLRRRRRRPTALALADADVDGEARRPRPSRRRRRRRRPPPPPRLALHLSTPTQIYCAVITSLSCE